MEQIEESFTDFRLSPANFADQIMPNLVKLVNCHKKWSFSIRGLWRTESGITLVAAIHQHSSHGAGNLDALFKIDKTERLDAKTKKRVVMKMKNVLWSVSEVERLSGLSYPSYYLEPGLTITESGDNIGGIGVLYARTLPIEINDRIEIIVQLTAPLVLYSTKALLKLVLAHEFLHYIELVRTFTRMDFLSQIASTSLYEERFTDYSRTVDPAKVFSNKKLVSDLKKKFSAGLDDEKLNEKCRINWIEKGMPVTKISLGNNQVKVSTESIVKTKFDPKAIELVRKMT